MSNPERPSFASPCDLDELKHQVREKAIAELKEYIEKDGAWSKVHTEFGSVHTVKSACGRFVLKWFFYGKPVSSSHSISYRGALAWAYYDNYEGYDCPRAQLFAEREREDAEPILKLHSAAMNWYSTKTTCNQYAKALGIEGQEWHPPGSVVEYDDNPYYTPEKTKAIDRAVILGGLCLLAIIIGAILL